jgi:hypothetical protein
MGGLCGRAKSPRLGNVLKEIGCTTSHLLAWYEAVNNADDTNPYAIVMEDDITFPFDIDFDALIKTVPVEHANDWGILSLFNSAAGTLESTWSDYVQNQNSLWRVKDTLQHVDFWSTCMYIINKQVIRGVLHRIVESLDSGLLRMRVLAGMRLPCIPRGCCEHPPVHVNKAYNRHGFWNLSAGSETATIAECILAPRGFQADSFLYATTKTLFLGVPLIGPGIDAGAVNSTIHNAHYGWTHYYTFRLQREIMSAMRHGEVAPPPFARPACAVSHDDIMNYKPMEKMLRLSTKEPDFVAWAKHNVKLSWYKTVKETGRRWKHAKKERIRSELVGDKE